MSSDYPFPIFRNYLETEDDKPYYTQNSLAFYYEDMSRKQKLIEDLAKSIAGYDIRLTENLSSIEQQVNAKLAEWNQQLVSFPDSVESLLEEWTLDGTIDTVIQTALIDEKIEPLTAQLADIATLVPSPNGVNDTQAIKDAFAIVKANGGEMLFVSNATYLVDGTIITPDGLKAMKIKGFNTKIKQIPRSTAYTTIYYDDKMEFEGLELFGYIESGTSWSNVIPSNSFGFRSNPNMKGLATFKNCNAHNFPTDGWYHSANSGSVKLLNSFGYDNLRNDFAAVEGFDIEIDGGQWGKNTNLSILNKVASIDIEPNTNKTIRRIDIKNLKTDGNIDIISNTGGSRILYASVKNTEFTNEVAGNKKGLNFSRVDRFVEEDNIYTGGAKLSRANLIADAQSRGRVEYPARMPESGNKLNPIYNAYSDWTVSTSTAGTISTNNEIGFYKGVRIVTAQGQYTNLRKQVDVVEGEWWTIGCQMKASALGGAKYGLYIIFSNSLKHYTLQPIMNEGVQWVSGSIEIPAGETLMYVKIGSEGSTPIDLTYAFPFVGKGRFSVDKVPLLTT